MVSVNQQTWAWVCRRKSVIRPGIERCEGLLHGDDCRLEDIHLVDRVLVDNSDAVTDRLLPYYIEEAFTLLFRNLLGIGKSRDQEAIRQHHGGGHHRSGQRPPAGLVQPGDAGEARRACASFEEQGIALQLAAE